MKCINRCMHCGREFARYPSLAGPFCSRKCHHDSYSLTGSISETQLRALYLDERLNTAQIAELIGCSSSTICNYLRRFGISLRNGGPPEGWRPSTETRFRWSQQRRGSDNAHFGKPQSPEAREKIAAKARGRIVSPEARQKMSASRTGEKNHFYGRHHSAESRAKIGAASRLRPPSHSKPTPFMRADGIAIRMRSTWEVRIAHALDGLGLDWQYEPKRFDLRDRSYWPDFYIPSLGCFYEVKGWFSPKSQETTRQFRECYPEIPLIVVNAYVLSEIEKSVGADTK